MSQKKHKSSKNQLTNKNKRTLNNKSNHFSRIKTFKRVEKLLLLRFDTFFFRSKSFLKKTNGLKMVLTTSITILLTPSCFHSWSTGITGSNYQCNIALPRQMFSLICYTTKKSIQGIFHLQAEQTYNKFTKVGQLSTTKFDSSIWKIFFVWKNNLVKFQLYTLTFDY